MRSTINEIVSGILPTGCLVLIIGGLVGAIPAWLTHVVVCIQDERYLFLIAGAIMWPIGVIHGFGIWFGAW